LWQRYLERCSKRKRKHGNWRQVVIDCGGMCIWRENGKICGAVSNLQFHEPFGEDKLGWNIFQQRVLLCAYHHDIAEQHIFRDNRFSFASKLMEDISFEILLLGGYDKWVEEFNLVDSFGRLLY